MATTPKTAKPAKAAKPGTTATPDAAAKAAPKAKAAAPKADKAPAVSKKVKDATEAKPGRKMDALQKPLTPSPELAEIVGKDMLPRGQVVSKVWEYIRKHNLQNPADKREILADDKLKKVFGRDKCTMFEMNKYLAQHLS